MHRSKLERRPELPGYWQVNPFRQPPSTLAAQAAALVASIPVYVLPSASMQVRPEAHLQSWSHESPALWVVVQPVTVPVEPPVPPPPPQHPNGSQQPASAHQIGSPTAQPAA